jgi:hypothetical protein
MVNRETIPATIRQIMSDPKFELGVRDARAGQKRHPNYESWTMVNDQWAYERGRSWALLVPRNVELKQDGKVTNEAVAWFRRIEEYIL